MAPLLVLLIVVPPLLLIVGIGVGVAAARWWWGWRWAGAAAAAAAAADEEQGLGSGVSTAVPSSSTAATADLPPGRKASKAGPLSIHIVASSCSLPLPSRSSAQLSADALAPLELSLGSASASPPLAQRLARPPPLQTPDPTLPDEDCGEQAAAAAAAAPHRRLVSLTSLGGGAISPLAHRKTLSLDLGQLVRAGPGVINQVMEDWEARSTLYRLMSMDGGAASASSPHAAAAAAAGVLSPAAAVLFSPVAGGGGGGSGAGGGVGGAMPKGEVHMDEIDLIECIGKGGYGCVYKASWRGAGVAVKYIVCPTDDADSLGRAIREVVLSRKMSHPNVVQCYSWTVLTENEGQQCRTPSTRSGLASPADQSFTGGRQRVLRHLAGAGSGSRSRRASLDVLRPGSARRGLDQRFSCAAVGPSGGGTPRSPSSLALHRITEHPHELHEGQESSEAAEVAASAAAWMAAGPGMRAGSTLPRPTVDSVVEELVAEAAAELEREQQQEEEEEQQQKQQEQEGQQQQRQEEEQPPPQQEERGSASPASLPPSPEAVGVAPGGVAKPLLKLALQPLGSCSPNGSPGIQAVHPQQILQAEEPAGTAAGATSEEQQVAGAAGLPPSPFAAVDVQAVPPRRSTSEGAASGVQHRLVLPFGGDGAVAVGAAAEQGPPPPQSSSEGEDGQDVYACFGSYEEMVAHFQSLAAGGQLALPAQQEAQQQRAPGAPGAVPVPAATVPLNMSRNGSGQQLNEYDMTAASSFSDVLSASGFMLEGSVSGVDLSLVPSNPASPAHRQRSGHSSWLPPSSAASSRALTPKSATAASAAAASTFSRLSRPAPWTAAQRQQRRQQPLGSSGLGVALELAAGMPPPAWWQASSGAGAEAPGQGQLGGVVASTAAAQLAARRLSSESIEPRSEPLSMEGGGASCRSSRDVPAGEASAAVRAMLGGLHCSSTISLAMWQPAGGASAAASRGCSLDLHGRPPGSSLDLQRQFRAGSSSSSSMALPYGAGSRGGSLDMRFAFGQFRGGSSSSLAPPAPSAPSSAACQSASEQSRDTSISCLEQQRVPAPRASSLGADSGSVTPRLGSLSSLAAVAGSVVGADSSLAVTPRQQSLRSSKCTPRGLLRVEELRAEAAAALGGGGGGGGEVAPASTDRLSLGSHNDSFNSEEGFGSPVKQRRGGVKDVFLLEELALEGQEALMVVVMEYCDLGSLRKALKRRAFRPSPKWPFQTTYRALLRTAQEIAKGMGYIHEFNIVHGDLKPGNVLLKTHKVDRRGYIAKVSDFGLSRALDFEDTHASLDATLGTIAYTAPETFAHNCLKKPSDVYAFGIMLWEMFYCCDPYEGLMDGQICVGVTDGSLRPEFDIDCPDPYRRLAERCWHQDPERRPSFEEVDAELVRIEMEFRLACHRTATASKRTSTTSQSGGSAPPSRPGSPEVQPRCGVAAGGGGALARQLQAAALAD